MRILANYGYKNNGDTYSVTFETMGDVPKEQADTVVDELFSMAKRAVKRQVEPKIADPLEFPPKDSAEGFQQDRKAGNGAFSQGTGSKPQLKDPTAPATRKQKNMIIRLAKEKGRFIEGLDRLTMREASSTIDELMAV